MFYNKPECTRGFFSVLNRCVATSFFTAPHGTGKTPPNHAVAEMTPRVPKILGQEKYLAIPTFIRQGKTLGL